MKRMNEYEEAIRSTVCTECLTPSGVGICGTGQWRDCPLNKFLPQAIDAVRAGKSPSLLAYFSDFLSATGDTRDESFEGSRMPPEDVEWFNRFLPLIAVAVEEVRLRTR